MKTIEEIKNYVAAKHGNIGICTPNSKLDIVIIEAMQEYAKQREIEIGVFLVDKGHVKASIDLLSFTPNVAEKP